MEQMNEAKLNEEQNSTNNNLILGIIGGSSLLKSSFHGFNRILVQTNYGDIQMYEGYWNKLKVIFCQRHGANSDGTYTQPRNINYQGIALAMQQMKCNFILGVYSVGSTSLDLKIGQIVVPNDFFSPFHILHISNLYEAHIVPGITEELRLEILNSLRKGNFNPLDGGVYGQALGPRFETKAEIRFFSQFCDVIGMTGAHEAGLFNELNIPFAMISIVDNYANGIQSTLTLKEFKESQDKNLICIESALIHLLNFFSNKNKNKITE